jgi:hypothetical protein
MSRKSCTFTRLDIAEAEAPPRHADSFEVDVRACETRRLENKNI